MEYWNIVWKEKDFGYYDAKHRERNSQDHRIRHGMEGYLGVHVGFILKTSGRTSGGRLRA